MGPDHEQELFRRALGFVHVENAGDPPLPRQDTGGGRHLVDQGQGFLVVGDEVFQPASQPAGATTPPLLRPQQPATQFARLRSRQLAGKGAVGGVEHMVPLVENISTGNVAVVAPAQRGGNQHQRVIGDDDVGPLRAPHRAFDETARPVIASGKHAFPAAIGQPQSARPPDEIDQPAGKVPAGQITVARRPHPARHQPDGDGVTRIDRHGADRVLQIQQTEVILAPLADDDLLRAHDRIGVKPGQLVLDLVLQVAGVGGDPHRRPVAFRPHRRRRQIAQRLADPRSGFRQHHVGGVGGGARGEGGGDRPGVVRLLRTGFRHLARPARRQEFGQSAPRVLGIDGELTRRRKRRPLLPLRQARPDPQGRALGLRRPLGPIESGEDRPGPGPTGLSHLRRQRQGLARVLATGGSDLPQQTPHGAQQGQRLPLQPLGRGKLQRQGQTLGRGKAKRGGPDESEEFERVERRKRLDTQPSGERAGVTHDGRIPPNESARRRDRHPLDLPVGRENDGPRGPRHDGGSLGERPRGRIGGHRFHVRRHSGTNGEWRGGKGATRRRPYPCFGSDRLRARLGFSGSALGGNMVESAFATSGSSRARTSRERPSR